MKPTKTEQLRKLLAEATRPEWRTYPIFGDNYAEIHGIQDSNNSPLVLDSQPNANLICFLRNNAALLLEIVEAVEKMAKSTSHDEDEDSELAVYEALRKWNGGE